MKKLLALILAILMLLSVVACDVETSTDDDDKNSSGNQTDDDTDGNNQNNNNNTESGDQSNNNENNNEITFSEIVVVDNAECVIKVTGIDRDNMWGYTLKVYLENKSSEKTYMFSVENAAINGVQCDPFFAAEVAAGKKANEEINFDEDEFEENGIKDYTDIELTFRVYDTNDWMADDVAVETVRIYPYGEDKAVKYIRTPQANDNVVVDNEYVTVVVTGYEYNEILGYTVKLFLLNKTEKNIMFNVEDAAVNGYMADPFFAKSVCAGKCAFSSISWSDTDLEENGITEIEEIEFNLQAYDYDSWSEDYFVDQTITLNP